MLAAGIVGAQQTPPPTHAQQLPVFRGGTQLIRVDAYPFKDGQIIRDLTADDFEILEDGKPQAIDSIDYVTFPTWAPGEERLRLDSEQSGFDLAADPRYRVFVIVVDILGSGNVDIHNIQKPLANFVRRTVGPRDLFGFLTTRNTAKDLILGQQTDVAESLIDDLFRSANIDFDEAHDLTGCGLEALKPRFRTDQTYAALESLVAKLGSLRQERKNIIFVSNSISRAKPDRGLLPSRPTVPRIGVAAGIVGVGKHTSGQADDSYCLSEAQKLANMDFDSRYRALLDEARRQNVAFYPVAPLGLPACAGPCAVERQYDDLRSLASETGGRAIVDTNDLDGGLRKIADDLSSYYLLGYYTTNTKWDGQVRKITVKLKSTGDTVPARSEYRAPTAGEIAALASGGTPKKDTAASDAASRESALSVLDRASGLFAIYAARTGGTLTVVTELTPQAIQSGRWKDGADLDLTLSGDDGDVIGSAHGRIGGESNAAALTLRVSGTAARAMVRVRDEHGTAADGVKLDAASATLVGDPLVYRSTNRIAEHPAAAFEFARNERIRIEWPVLAPIEMQAVRLLDRNGRAIPVELPLAPSADQKTLGMQMGLSGFGAGDYLIELTATAHGASERKLLAIRIRP